MRFDDEPHGDARRGLRRRGGRRVRAGRPAARSSRAWRRGRCCTRARSGASTGTKGFPGDVARRMRETGFQRGRRRADHRRRRHVGRARRGAARRGAAVVRDRAAAGAVRGARRAWRSPAPRRATSWPRRGARIVEAGDAERRRLERNLHDGAQQRLVGLSMGLRLARRKLRDAPGEARRAARGHVRRALRGDHRPARAGAGDPSRPCSPTAASARRSRCSPRARRSRSSSICACRSACRTPVEVAAYYVASEALANVVKHSGARLGARAGRRHDGCAEIEVADDGAGTADRRRLGPARAARPRRDARRPAPRRERARPRHARARRAAAAGGARRDDAARP